MTCAIEILSSNVYTTYTCSILQTHILMISVEGEMIIIAAEALSEDADLRNAFRRPKA